MFLVSAFLSDLPIGAVIYSGFLITMNLHKFYFLLLVTMGFIFGKGGFLITISLVSIFLSVNDFANFNLYLMVVNTFAENWLINELNNKSLCNNKMLYIIILSIFSLSGTIIYFFF